MVPAILLSIFGLGLLPTIDAAAVAVQIDAYQDVQMGPMRPTIEIGTALTLTCCSRYHVMGQVLRRAYELYFDWVNSARGGVNVGGVQYNIKLTLIDDQSSQLRVYEITDFLVHKRGVKFFLGPYSSTLTAMAAAVLNMTDAVMVAPGSAAPLVFKDRPRAFGTMTPATVYLESSFQALLGRALSAGYIAEEGHFTNVTCDTVPGFSQKYDMVYKGGITISADADDDEVLKAMEKIMLDPPELLIGCTYYSVCKRMIKAAKKLDFTPKAMLMTVCVSMPEFMEEMGETGRYILGATQWSPTMNAGSPNNTWTPQTFAKAYMSRYGVPPPYQAASAWASGEALVQAIEEAGSLDPSRVMGALRILEAQTVFGRVAFNEDGQSLNVFNSVQFPQEGPILRIVAPESRQERPMVFPMKTWRERPCLQREHVNFGYNNLGLCAPCDYNSQSVFDNKTLTRSCAACEEGEILDENFKCIVCGKGELVSPDGRKCFRCRPGKYKSPNGINPETGLTYKRGDRCTACDAGYYQDKEAQEECKPCWPGTFSESPGSPKCNRCAPLARHPYVDEKVLDNRPFRWFCRREASTTALASECDKCVAGDSGVIKDAAICCDYALARHHKVLSAELGKEVRYCSHGDPASAPPIFCSKAVVPPACPDVPQHNPVQETFYQPLGKSTSCLRCKQGTLCEATCPELKPNCTAPEVVRTSFDAGVEYYVMRHQEALAMNSMGLGPFKCITPGACVGRNKCIWGEDSKHQGMLCGSCAPGYTTKSVEELCQKCPDKVINALLAIAGVLFLGVYIGTFIKYSLIAVHQPKAVEGIVLKVFINYCQMTAVSFAVAKIGIEDYLSWYIDACSFLSQDPVGVLMSLDCLLDLRDNGTVVDYFNLNLALIILPIACVSTCLVYTAITAVIRIRRKAFGQEYKKWHPKMYIPVVLVVIFFTHPIATQYFLSVFDCSKKNPGTKYQYDVERLLTNLDVDCTSEEHLVMQWQAVIGITVISFGTPAFVLAILFVCKEKLHTEKYMELIGFLYNGFEPDVYYFEVVIMVRKVLFVICSVIPGLDDDGRVTVMLFVAIIFLAVNNSFEPWDDRAYNLLDRIEAASLRAIILLLLARLVQAVTDTSYRFRDESAREKRDIVLHVMVLSQHVWVLALIWWGIFRDNVQPYLQKCSKPPETVELDQHVTLDATRITLADRAILVDIYGDAVNCLLDKVKVVDLRDLGMIIRGAITIANAEKVDKAAQEGYAATFDKAELKRQHETRDTVMSRKDIPGLVDRDWTTLPKEIMLAPLTVEELQMGWIELLNIMQIPEWEMSILERYGTGDIIDLEDQIRAPANTLLQATKAIVQGGKSKRIYSVNNDLALFNMGEESPEQKMARKWKQQKGQDLKAASSDNKKPLAITDVFAPKSMEPREEVLTLPKEPEEEMEVTEIVDI